ncbi:hypothetical protein COU57_04805 [Candidatus Pacearchaeota archaeon CG10_big_fil_rev_8_21_14_0_10_32_14]|nr:MAG: hypothetical protein COU57_04805 [Candidatus Pacearchaeota archaeon CG10_big_fil_rev_8_21_14_0_10_32_14]
MTKYGSLIVIEGTDASGKETQTKMLVDRLNKEGNTTKHISFPRYETPTGRVIAQAYLGKSNPKWNEDKAWFGDADKVDPHIASLYYAADRMAAAHEMEQILESGTHLVLDRYYQSNMAHQGGKIIDESKRMLIFDFIKMLEVDTLKIPEEKGVIFLYMPCNVAFELRKRRGEEPDGHEINSEHLKRAEESYLHLSKHFWWKWAKIDCAPDGTMNSLRTPQDIAEEVYDLALKLIRK